MIGEQGRVNRGVDRLQSDGSNHSVVLKQPLIEPQSVVIVYICTSEDSKQLWVPVGVREGCLKRAHR